MLHCARTAPELFDRNKTDHAVWAHTAQMTAPTTQTVPASDLIDDALALARSWAAASSSGANRSEQAASDRLGHLVADRAGLDLAVAFVDRVARPEDTRVAAKELADLPAADAAAFLSPADRLLFAAGQRLAPVMPDVVVPAARARLRQLVGHLVVDAADGALTRHLKRSRQAGYRLNINLLGEAVLGEREAASRAERTIALVQRPDVDYVSIKVSSLVSHISAWDLKGTVSRAVERLRPLYRAALANGAFVNLDMEEYRDLDLTCEVFTALLSEPEFARLDAGIVLQAYLPDSQTAFERLLAFATDRVEHGGARIKVRLVKGANLAMERVESELHGWPQAPHTSKAGADATYVRILDRALRPEVARVLRIGVAGHNLYHLALAHLLATGRGVSEAMDVEMLQGMAPAQARAVWETVGRVLLYTPVVARSDFDVAVSYLVRRLEENAAPENYLHQSLAAGGVAEAERRFIASVRQAGAITACPRRRGEPTELADEEPFRNAADSDPAVAAVRERVRSALEAPYDPTPTHAHLTSTAQVDHAVGRARAIASAWREASAASRSAVLNDVARRIEAHRLDLMAVMAHEGGKIAAESDPEISEAADFARWYARHALDVGAEIDGARFEPYRLTLVTPPWNFPVAIAVGGVLAALAAGSAVVMKPSPNAARAGEIVSELVREALAAGGFDPDLVQVVHVAEDEVGRHLIAHDGVDQVILTGSLETATLFATWRAHRPHGPGLSAETSGKNAIIVTPSADLDLAVADVVRSAFGHAGQKCSAASLVILVGSIGRSRRFHRQLVDATTSLRVGIPQDLGAMMGPVIEVPSGKLRRALTQLEPGENWVVRPRELPATGRWQGRLWTPGVRAGVAPGSWFHLTECFGPVLGVMHADTLDEAIEWQNATAFGLTGGLHSLDEAEIARWQDRVEVGNAYINRGITGAIVRRQPFGGWKGSVVGPGAKAGGPFYVAQQGRWVPTKESDLAADLLDGDLASRDAALARQWRAGADASGLACEENTLRLLPVPCLTVRVGVGVDGAALGRVLAAAAAAQVPQVAISAASPIEAPVADAAATALTVVVESEESFLERIRDGGVGGRVRWLGGTQDPGSPRWQVCAASQVGLSVDPVVRSSERELLAVMREQAISRTKHRFGHVHE